MEVKLKAGDSLNIPEGCKAVIKDNVVVVEKEEKELKDGDVLVVVIDNVAYPFIFFKTSENFCWYHVISRIGNVRYATEEERRQLFDKMKEKGWQWNAENKCVELNRWKAKEGEPVYFVNLHQDDSIVSNGITASEEYMWEIYNYFRTKEQAEEAARRMREVLRQYHEEIGE